MSANATPFLAPALGMERFGLLSLAWVLLVNMAIFDLGLGTATTRPVAEALGARGVKKVFDGSSGRPPRFSWSRTTGRGAWR